MYTQNQAQTVQGNFVFGVLIPRLVIPKQLVDRHCVSYKEIFKVPTTRVFHFRPFINESLSGKE